MRIAPILRSLSLLLVFVLSLSLVAFATRSPAAQDLSKSAKIKPLKVSPKKIQFGTLLPFQASGSRDVTIHNPNSSAINVSSVSTTNGEFVPSDNCTGSIPADSDCSVAVVFTPSSDGKKSAKLMIVDNASTKVSMVTLDGEGKGMAPTPTATATATPTPTATPTFAPCPAPGSCASGPPSLTSLVPSSAVAGGPNVLLSACGCNLTGATTVQWNGTNQPTTFVSANQLDATIPAANIASIGAINVTAAASAQVSSPQTFFVGNTGGASYAQVIINQVANDLVSDPVNNVLYLSVPGSAPTNGNTISVVSLASASITSSTFAGSNPDKLAIADDSSLLYVGLDGSASVARFTLPGISSDITIPLGGNDFGAYFALDLQVAPGAPDTTAISLGNMSVSPEAEGGIVIYDNSTPRTNGALGWDGGDDLYDSLQWGADDTVLYAANTEDTAFDFYSLAINSMGVASESDFQSTFASFNDKIHFDATNGLIYANYGLVIDPSTASPVGTFSPSSFPAVMVPDSTLNEAFFIEDDGTLESFNLNEFSRIASITIPDFPGIVDYTAASVRILRWGTNGLAILPYQGPIYLIGGNFVH